MKDSEYSEPVLKLIRSMRMMSAPMLKDLRAQLLVLERSDNERVLLVQAVDDLIAKKTKKFFGTKR